MIANGAIKIPDEQRIDHQNFGLACATLINKSGLNTEKSNAVTKMVRFFPDFIGLIYLFRKS